MDICPEVRVGLGNTYYNLDGCLHNPFFIVHVCVEAC